MASAAPAVVYDASAALEALLPDSSVRLAQALELLQRIAANEVVAHVPLIFFNEVAAGCARAVRGKRVAQATAASFLSNLNSVPLQLSVAIDPARQWFDRAMHWHCQVADSAY